MSTPRSLNPTIPRETTGRRWGALLLASVGIGGLAFWLLRAGALPVLPERQQLLAVGLQPLAVYSMIWLVTLGLKCSRWYFQVASIARVSLARVCSVNLVALAAVALFPFRSGEFVRPMLITRGTSVPFLAAMSTTVAERIIDGVFASLLLIVSLASANIIEPLPDRIGDLPVPAAIVPTLGYMAAVATLSAVSVVVAFFYFRQPMIRLVRAMIGVFSHGLSDFVAHRLDELARGLAFLGDRRNAVRYLAVTALHWTAHWVGVWYLFSHSGFPTFTLPQAGVVLGTVAFGAGLPNAPGLFGIFQIAIFASLALFFAPEVVQGAGGVAGFWLYVLEMGWCFSLALVGLLLERRYWRVAPAAVATLD